MVNSNTRTPHNKSKEKILSNNIPTPKALVPAKKDYIITPHRIEIDLPPNKCSSRIAKTKTNQNYFKQIKQLLLYTKDLRCQRCLAKIRGN